MMVTAMICGVMLAGCGGSGGSAKSGLKSNEYLGSLPALIADYALANDAAQEKTKQVKEKAAEKQDFEKLLKVEEQDKKEWSERNGKFEEAQKAEWDKINGKDIPFKCSDAFGQMSVQVGSVNLNAANMGLVITVTAKEDFTVYSTRNFNEYQQFHYRVLAKDGSVIETNSTSYVYAMVVQPKPFKQGDAIKSGDGDLKGNLGISRDPAKWVEFASIEFISYDEYLK
jgi:hypothetical protein